MNKREVEQMIPVAYDALKSGIAESGKINSGFKGQIASFGAAVTMGSLLSAIAFFSKQGGSATERDKLLEDIWKVAKKTYGLSEKSMFEYVRKNNTVETKEQIINAAIAIKLAMNLFEEAE